MECPLPNFDDQSTSQTNPLSLTPADNSAYTTEELITLFTSLEARLTGYAESLLGVAKCLDSLQTQIKGLQREREGGSSDAASDCGENEEEHAVDQEEWEGEAQKSSGEKVDGIEEPEWRGEGDGAGKERAERPEGGGDGEVNAGGLGNIVSGFVFGDDDDGRS